MSSLIGIQYVLAMLIIDNIDIEKVLPKMIDIGGNLGKYDLKSVLELLDLPLFEETVKKYCKK